jgi:hypothetical protein
MDDVCKKRENCLFEVYERILLIAYSNGANLENTLLEAESDIHEFNENRSVDAWLPKGCETLLFIEIMAEKLGVTSASFFIPNPDLKDRVVSELIEIGKQSFDCMDIDYIDEENPQAGVVVEYVIKKKNNYCKQVDFNQYLSELSLFRETEEIANDDKIMSSYAVMLRKNEEDYDIVLRYNLPFWNSGNHEYFFSNAQIYSEEKGALADFINLCVQKKEEKQRRILLENEKIDIENDREITLNSPMETIGRNISHVDIAERKGTELVVSIYDTTHTVDVLDKYEGLDKEESKPYERLVIANGNRSLTGNKYYIHYVIERSRRRDFIGDITFTEFKKGYIAELNRHVKDEIKKVSMEEYLDKKEFIRFDKPYHLRAQNSRNRTGYGWEWDWSGGYGDYTEGTLYGETTDYIFAGVYISSAYIYDPSKRQLTKEIKKVSEDENIIYQSINAIGYIKGTYLLVVCSEQLPKIPGKKRLQLFVKVSRNGKIKYVPVAYDADEKRLYINKKTFDFYRPQFNSQQHIKIFKTFIDG